MSHPDACIRPAAPGDAAELAALARRVFVATYGAAIPAPTLRAYFHEHMTPTCFRAQIAAGPLLVAVADARLAGYARIHRGLPAACACPAPAPIIRPGHIKSILRSAPMRISVLAKGRG